MSSWMAPPAKSLGGSVVFSFKYLLYLRWPVIAPTTQHSNKMNSRYLEIIYEEPFEKWMRYVSDSPTRALGVFI